MFHPRAAMTTGEPKIEPLLLTDSNHYQMQQILPPCVSAAAVAARLSAMDSMLYEEQEQKPLDLLDMYNLLHGDSWEVLDQSRALKPFPSNMMQQQQTESAHCSSSSFASDPHLELLSALVRKTSNAPEVSHTKLNPTVDFPVSDLGSLVVRENQSGIISPGQHNHFHVANLESEMVPSIVPKLPAKRLVRESSQNKRGKKVGIAQEATQREIHIQSERQRRQGMNHLFDTMRSLLPNGAQKIDKSKVISEVINYIQSLHQVLEELNKKRSSMHLTGQGRFLHIKSEQTPTESIQSDCTGSSSTPKEAEFMMQEFDATVHFNGTDVFISVTCPKKANLLSAMILIVEEHNLQLLGANVSVKDELTYTCLHLKSLGIPALAAKQALKRALQKVVCSRAQIFMDEQSQEKPIPAGQDLPTT